MRLTKTGSVYLLIAFLSAVFSYLIVTFEYFPYLGFSVSAIIFATLVYWLKKERSNLTKTLYSVFTILALFLIIRSEELLTFINVAVLFYTGSLMSLSGKEDKNFSAVRVISSPLLLLFPALFKRSDYSLEFDKNQKLSFSDKKTFDSIKIAVITLFVLLTTIPLLASANPIFADLVSKITGLFNLKYFLDLFDNLTIFKFTVRLMFFVTLLVITPKLVTYINNEKSKLDRTGEYSTTFSLLIPKIALSTVLLIFFITQLQLYFATEDALIKMGYTHSQYAREVFTQLTLVSAVLLTLIYNDKNKNKINTFFTYFLLILGGFLTLMALKSVYDYSNKWGFTYKRLYGFTGVAWSAGIYLLYCFRKIKSWTDNVFIIRSVIFSFLILIAVNSLNFDYLIYHFRKTNLPTGVDYNYLSILSPDSLSYKEQFDNLVKTMPKTNQDPWDVDKKRSAGYNLLYKIRYLQNKYKDKFDLRTFNLTEYLQYLEIQTIDTQHYFTEWTSDQNTSPY